MARPKNTPMQEQLKKDISEALSSIMERRGINQVELSERAGIPKTTLNGYVKGTSLPTPGNTEKMARVLNVSKAEIDPRFRTDLIPKNVIEVTGKVVRIPILGTIACGNPILAEENFKGFKEELIEFVPKGELFYLEAKGDSMEPTIKNGSMVLIRHQQDIENGEIAAVLVNGDAEITLKRVKKQGDIVMLCPDNSSYHPYIITEANPARIIGKAIRYVVDL